MEKGDGDSGGDGDVGRKSKRARTRTQPFQSSDLDEAKLLRIMKASAQTAKPPVQAAAQAKQASNLALAAKAASDDKLVVFFKGEFLAVRNDEGGFYVCQVIRFSNL